MNGYMGRIFMVRFKTERYALSQDRFGHFRLTRKTDNASAYFMGDDADLWERNMTAIEGIKDWPESNPPERSFDFLCSGYDEILQQEESR